MSDFHDAKTGVEQFKMLPRQGTFVHIAQVFRLADKALGERGACIAELGAELKAWRKMIAQMDRLRLEQVERAEQAEAELADAKAQLDRMDPSRLVDRGDA